MANMTTAARVGMEKHPKKISKNLNYGTAGFRSRFVFLLVSYSFSMLYIIDKQLLSGL